MISSVGRIRGGLAAITFLVVLLLQTGGLGSVDAYRRLQATHSFWTSEPAVRTAEEGSYGLPGRNGRLQNNYGMGQSILMLPADVIGTTLVRNMHGHPSTLEKLRVAVVTYLTFPLANTIAVLIAFELLRSLGASLRAASLGALGLLLLTTFLHDAQIHQENNLILLLTSLSFLGAVRWLTTGAAPWAALAAAACAANLLVRIPTVLDLAAVCGFLALAALSGWERPPARVWLKHVGLIAVPIVIAAVFVDRLYQYERFGNWTGTYTAVWAREERKRHPDLPAAYPFSGSFEVGFMGPFFSERKSVFLFDPVVVLSLLSLVSTNNFARLVRPFVISALLLLLADVAFHARLEFWHGDHAWGDRFISVPVHLLCLIGLGYLAEVWPTLGRRGKTAGAFLCAVSLLLQGASTVFLATLEIVQESAAKKDFFIIGKRFANILGLLTGRLARESATFPGKEEIFRVAYMPFNLEAMMAHHTAVAVQACWWTALIVTGICVARFARRAHLLERNVSGR